MPVFFGSLVDGSLCTCDFFILVQVDRSSSPDNKPLSERWVSAEMVLSVFP